MKSTSYTVALLSFGWVDQRIQKFYNYHIGSFRTVVGYSYGMLQSSYRTAVLLTHFIKETCLFIQ